MGCLPEAAACQILSGFQKNTSLPVKIRRIQQYLLLIFPRAVWRIIFRWLLLRLEGRSVSYHIHKNVQPLPQYLHHTLSPVSRMELKSRFSLCHILSLTFWSSLTWFPVQCLFRAVCCIFPAQKGYFFLLWRLYRHLQLHRLLLLHLILRSTGRHGSLPRSHYSDLSLFQIFRTHRYEVLLF